MPYKNICDSDNGFPLVFKCPQQGFIKVLAEMGILFSRPFIKNKDRFIFKDSGHRVLSPPIFRTSFFASSAREVPGASSITR